jgi:hypothetical protein
LVAEQEAPAWAAALLAPTCTVPAHCPSLPAVQAEFAFAVLRPPAAAAVALPVSFVRQPVPAQVAWTCAVSFATVPAVAAWQPPAAAQVAVPVALTFAAPTAFAVAVARVAQPAFVPLSHAAVA